MRALYSRLKKQDSSRDHFNHIVRKRSKMKSINMGGTNFLQMVLDYLHKHEVCNDSQTCNYFHNDSYLGL